MKARKILFGILLTAYVVMWIGGVGNYVIFGKPPLDASWAATAFLALAGLLVVASSAGADRLALLIGAGLGFVAEIVGVRYGFLFSPYQYTQVLWPLVAGVPVVMLAAWMVLLAYAWQLVLRSKWPRLIQSALAAGWMTAIDLVIDPLAAGQLGYWRWASAGKYYGIPLRNFVGWFVVSFVISCLIRRRWQMNRWALYIGLSIVIFFTAIAWALGLLIAGGVGLVLCGIHLALVMERGGGLR